MSKGANIKWFAAFLAFLTIWACGGGGGPELDTGQMQVEHQVFYPPVYYVPNGLSAYKPASAPGNTSPTLPAPAVQDFIVGGWVIPNGTLEYQIAPPQGADHVYIDIIYSSIAVSRWGIPINATVATSHILLIPLPGNLTSGTYAVQVTYTQGGQLSNPSVLHFKLSPTPTGTYQLSQPTLYFSGTLTSITPAYGQGTHASQLTLSQNGKALDANLDGTVMSGTAYSGGWFSVANSATGDVLAGQIMADGSIGGSAWHVNSGGLTSIYLVSLQPSSAPAVVQEQEPNDTKGTATALGNAWSAAGTIASPTDTDYFYKALGPGTYQFSFTQGVTSVSSVSVLFDNGQATIMQNNFASPFMFTLKSGANAFFALSGDATHSGAYQFVIARTAKK